MYLKEEQQFLREKLKTKNSGILKHISNYGDFRKIDLGKTLHITDESRKKTIEAYFQSIIINEKRNYQKISLKYKNYLNLGKIKTALKINPVIKEYILPLWGEVKIEDFQELLNSPKTN